MEVVEDIAIVGAGIAGLTTSLGLHRLGYRSLVLETSNCLRSTGFALSIWTNGWKALDAVGIGDSLREHLLISGNVVTSMTSGLTTSEVSFKAKSKLGDHELRCLRRAALLESLGKELPIDTIRFSSKVVNIEESGYLKLVHLADGTILKTKVLIGCDGVNSVVAKWLGFKKPTFSEPSAFKPSLPAIVRFPGAGLQIPFVTAPSVDTIGIPSECLMLKNMFDPTAETELDFDLDIKEDVEDECSKFVKHIYVKDECSVA